MLRGALDIAAPDPRVYAVLAEAGFGPDLFNPGQHRSCELVERYAQVLAIDLCRRLGVLDVLGRARTPDEIRTACGFVASFDRPLRWLLEHARSVGVLAHDGEAYRLLAPPDAPAPAEMRRAGLAADPSYAPAYDLLDIAAELYPRVARGEVQAERALFLRVSLWVAYFSNANGFYALSNRVAAHAAADRLPGTPGAVLEVGAGLGSATAALLEELRAQDRLSAVHAYDATEPVVFFRRRAERTLVTAWPDVRLAFQALDLNQPWAAQGIAPGSRALVWGVNVFHLARDLDAVLREARAALVPGGWLVVGEGVRPEASRPVGAELPFQLLGSFHDVQLDPVRRPNAGFLTADAWQGALRRAGFVRLETVPDVQRVQACYPGFVAAAFCARRT